MALEEQERTEQATPKRREEARKKGQVVRSREITSAFLILGLAGGLVGMGPMMVSRFRGLMFQTWDSFSRSPMTERSFYDLMTTEMAEVLFLLVPITGFMALIGIASLVIQQGGFLWAADSMSPDWSRLNPVAGLKRILSIPSLAELGKAVIKFLVLGYVLYAAIRREWPHFLVLIQLEPTLMLAEVGRFAVRLSLWAGLTIALLGVADYAFQWWEHERKLRMSRKELREEMKESEGDPLLRSRVRSLQREMARRRMMLDVPKADVVLTNPTTLAVALMYRQADMQAPKVVAKGAGPVAEKIREIARRHGVPVMENKPLARALYKTVEVGELIPQKLYRAAAEVLSYVYRLRGKRP